MRKLIRLYGFWYGFFATLFAFGWYVSALRGNFAFPHQWWIVEVIFAMHCCAAVVTFQNPIRVPWQPAIHVTRNRTRLAKTLLGAATLNFLVWMGSLLVAVVQRNPVLEGRSVPLILTSFLLQNTVYIAVHWAIRPENLFPKSFVQAVSNPLGLVWPAKKKQE